MRKGDIILFDEVGINYNKYPMMRYYKYCSYCGGELDLNFSFHLPLCLKCRYKIMRELNEDLEKSCKTMINNNFRVDEIKRLRNMGLIK